MLLVKTGRNLCCLCLVSLFSCLLALSPNCSLAESSHAVTSKRFTLYFGEPESRKPQADIDYDSLAKVTLSVLQQMADELGRVFEIQPQNRVVIRFLEPDEFRERTGAPAWTNAMYFGGEISIPITPELGVDVEELRRAVRHEYVHAVTAEISDQRCPAWLDEGVAQLVEGPANPILGPSLRSWMATNDPLPLSWLQDGFMGLNKELVPVAYAQSLFAARSLVRTSGYPAIRNYLQNLATGMDDETAFHTAFGKTRTEFETRLAAQLDRWSESSAEHP